jgi:3',5'-cyclic AMP phosphodiesterase CpdA
VTPRVVVVSDSHFSVRTPEADRNWNAVLRHVDATEPDLVLHVGDVTVDGARDPEELRLAHRRLDRLTELPDHGALAPTWTEPDGMAQLTLGEDIPSPYEPAATEAAP